MATSRRTRLASEKYTKNIDKRGQAAKNKKLEKDDTPPVSKPVMFFLIFVVIGSSIFGMISMVKKGAPRL
ncbi:hypothetical protein ScalyP_jg8122 [Parmales sp. scaly parma]|nr:hypothetical protein ScalyP_jg8122 [Parmales sp. scaly parma]